MSEVKHPSVGIVGVGNMGGGMAAHLLAQGWSVHIFDLDAVKANNFEQNGAIAHANSAQLAINC